MKTYYKQISKEKYGRIRAIYKDQKIKLDDNLKETSGLKFAGIEAGLINAWKFQNNWLRKSSFYVNGFIYQEVYNHNGDKDITYWRLKAEPVRAFNIDFSYYGESDESL